MKFKRISGLIFLLCFVISFAQTNEQKQKIEQLLHNRESYNFEETNARMDQAIQLALDTQNKEIISNCYLEKAGFNFWKKKYKTALENYVLATKYVNKKENPSLHYSIQYGLALSNQQIGNLNEAEKILLECYDYFKEDKDNAKNKMAYSSVLGRLTFLYILKKDFVKAEKYNVEQLNIVQDKFSIDYAIKNKGILLYYKKQYDESIELLNRALIPVKNNGDVYWEMYTLYYLGENYDAKGMRDKAMQYYQQVENLFVKTKITDTHLRNNFLKLNDHYKKIGDKNKQVELINELIEFDSINYVVNQEVSQHYFDGYIKNNLASEKNQLNQEISSLNLLNIILWIVLGAIVVIAVAFYISMRNKNKMLSQKVDEYLSALEKAHQVEEDAVQVSDSDANVFNDIKIKLMEFEENKMFIDPDVSLQGLANQFNTNRTTLSKYINTYKDKNFRKYINDLRIEYIIRLLIQDPKYKEMTMDALAEECGFNSRQRFSDAFLDSTQVRPKDFIKNISNSAYK